MSEFVQFANELADESGKVIRKYFRITLPDSSANSLANCTNSDISFSFDKL